MRKHYCSGKEESILILALMEVDISFVDSCLAYISRSVPQNPDLFKSRPFVIAW
jgi:hypothetical protein